jgi:hypothetical protein
MNEPLVLTVESFENYLTLALEHPTHQGYGWFFRGVSQEQWEPIPKAFRPGEGHPDDCADADLDKFHHWKLGAIAYCQNLPEDEIDCLAYARHHGLNTRLLDWSTNPLVGLYFSVFESPDTDGAVYLMTHEENTTIFGAALTLLADRQRHKRNIRSLITGTRYLPPALNQRILSQNAVFTIQKLPSDKLSDFVKMKKVLVPRRIKLSCLLKLDSFGINHASLFPDLDGFSRYHNWRMSRLRIMERDGSARQKYKVLPPDVTE